MSKLNGRKPLYHQIRQYVTDQINQGIWKAGDRLPSEAELAKQFGASRVTIKTAISELIDNNAIYRVQGKGTFVSADASGEPVVYEPKKEENLGNRLIAFILPAIVSSFTTKLLDGMEKELSGKGYKLLYCSTASSQEEEKRVLNEVLALGVSGIVIFPVDGESYNEQILRLKLGHFPFVVVDRYFRGIETNSVCADNIEGGRLATEMLISLGHRQIGLVSTRITDTTSVEDRVAGYEKALSQHHIAVDHRLRITDFESIRLDSVLKDGQADPDALKAICTFIRSNPEMTAIFALNLSAGLTIVQAVESIGLRIPEDLSVVFFDQFEMADFAKVPPTCIVQDATEISKAAVELLLSAIRNPYGEPRRVTLTPQLLIRESCAPPSKKALQKNIFTTQ
ncbi:GntR family transcriptional regulator [Cohnella phaseoli]|uniref:GntR family transcriptional regulator of arabinose operon n=1 Tax=Cohnella phaseoli TaxID=456490 RepID=A0A3D9I824_9BACL|nr:GntR family transcriptional regulator [Cohnella phaseoli]RED57928.1 GntR family transcriptional regulator of arabinose operon [Cohnella phaseoli]